MLEPIYSTNYNIKPGDLLCFKFPIEQHFILKRFLDPEISAIPRHYCLLKTDDIVMVVETNVTRSLYSFHERNDDYDLLDGFVAMAPNCQLIWCSIQELENFKKIKK